jgi:hypothetical protein
MNWKLFTSAAIVALACSACQGQKTEKGLADGATGDIDEYESTAVNAVVQAKPEIMILPSDNTLSRFDALGQENVNGTTVLTRNYQQYLLNDKNARAIYSTIQDLFQKQDFPLNDLEQTLKQLNTHEATDLADGMEKDAKTILLTTATPDIVLELDYGNNAAQANGLSHNINPNATRLHNLTFTLNAMDAYTNKVVATVTTGKLSGSSVTDAVNTEMKKVLPGLMTDLQTYFSDLLKRGREITVRVAIKQGSNVNLSDTNAEGDTYSDYVVDYMKRHTVKGAYKLQRNTDMEISFTGCRIRLLNEDGTQLSAYDWARDLARSLRRDLGVKVTNKSQGLGEVVLTIEGL